MDIVCKIAFLIALLFLLTTWLLWKMKKIHIRFNFGSKEKAEPKHYEIKALLDEISGEIIVASQAFYAWKSIHNFASKDNTLHKAINSNALSWNIFLHSLQATFFISLGRFFINRARFALRNARRDYSNLLLLGTGPTTLRIIRHIRNDPHWNYKIAGVVSIPEEGQKQKELDGAPILGRLDEFSDILLHRNIDEVILTVPSLPRDKTMSIILECEKRMVKFRLIADLLGMITSKVDMENIDGVPLLGLKEFGFQSGFFLLRLPALNGRA